MNKNILIVLGGGFLIALLVAIIVQASFGKKGDGMVEVAVAAQALPMGTPVTDVNFKWQAWPEDSVFEGAVRREGDKKVSDLAKGKLRRDMNAGEPLTLVSLTSVGKGNVLAASMDPGMRAIAIKVSPQSMVGGFISPGDRVDVILTYQVRLSGPDREEAETKVNRHASQTVLENVRIMAIDQMAKKEDDKAKVGRTVTLEVDASGAEKLALASEMGELSLALRALGDTEIVNSAKRRLTTDVQVSSVLQEINRMKKTSGGKSDIVRVYSGENVENVTVRH
jgi:pilus assembly protein CpaB